MKKWIFLITLFLVATVSILFFQKIPHILVGQYLSPADVLTKADAIVVVSGDSDRMKHAVDLYKQGFAHKLILSGAAKEGFTSNALAMQLEASRSGIPNKAIILEERSANTYENAQFTKEIIKSQGIRSLILVSSPYHQRRAYETFNYVLRSEGVLIQNSPSIYSNWKVDNWWLSEKDTHLTNEEILKMLWIKISGNYK